MISVEAWTTIRTLRAQGHSISAISRQLQLSRKAIRHALRLDTLSRLDLLILDELGYLTVEPRRANLFFQLISRRYEHGSIILTSNKPFEEWGAVFGGDDVIAAAVIDRLIHHSHIIAISGPSFRAKDKRPSKQGGT